MKTIKDRQYTNKAIFQHQYWFLQLFEWDWTSPRLLTQSVSKVYIKQNRTFSFLWLEWWKWHLPVRTVTALRIKKCLVGNLFSKVLRLLSDGVERVALKSGPGIEGTTAIVGFSSHYSASTAKKMLVEGKRASLDGHRCNHVLWSPLCASLAWTCWCYVFLFGFPYH